MVMLVNSDSKVEDRIVESGRTIGDKVMVNDGLKGGEVLITAGLQKVRPGAVVNAVENSNGLIGLVSGKAQQAASVADME